MDTNDTAPAGGPLPASARAQIRQKVQTAAVRPDPIRDPVREPEQQRKTRKRKGDQDQFYIDPDLVPAGMTWEWKRHTVYGQPDPGYEVGLRENGWEPVDVTQAPNFMPPGWNGPIVRSGQMLMARPSYLTEEARQEEYARAVAQVKTKEEQLGVAPQGTGPRDHPQARPQVNKTYAPIPVPE